MHRDKGK